ncbi:MAG: hypothetical protein ACM3MI_09710 [Clostridiales bacterium]
MQIYKLQLSKKIVNALIKANAFLMHAKDPIIAIILNTIRHYVSRMKGRNDV